MSPISKSRDLFVSLSTTTVLLSALGGCNPYERRVADYSAGAVDPAKFPVAYLGAGGKGNRPGQGSFQIASGFVDGKPVFYYPLPFNGAQAKLKDPDPMADPVLGQLLVAKLPAPLMYLFDPKSQQDPGLDSDKCIKPDEYAFNPQTEAVRADRQGNIFTGLPVDSDPVGNTKYVPIVREVVVRSNGNPCQDIKSDKTLVQRNDVSINLNPPPQGIADALPSGIPSGKYVAYAIIDPAADVLYPEGTFPPHFSAAGDADTQHDPATGLGPQRFGWFQQYLLAYLDGGYIPVEDDMLHFKAQNLYVPDGETVGSGFDVMEKRRGDSPDPDGRAYSPICRVSSFTPKDPMMPETSVADIKANMDTITDQKRYVYCLQTP